MAKGKNSRKEKKKPKKDKKLKLTSNLKVWINMRGIVVFLYQYLTRSIN